MFTDLPKCSFNVVLPSSTSKEVVEWFEVMENSCRLTDALIELVHEAILSGKPVKAADPSASARNDAQPSQSAFIPNQNDLFENLYNWQESKSAVFAEEKKEKEKKKMLSV